MRLACLCCVLLVLGACQRAVVPVSLPSPANAELAASDRSADSAAIANHVRGMFTAISRGDTASLRVGLSDSLRWVLGTRGIAIGKLQLLGAASRTSPDVTLAYDVDSIRVWRVGAVATAEYRLVDRRTFGTHTNTFHSRGVDVFAFEVDAWRLRHHAQAWIVGPPDVIALDAGAAQAFVGRYERGPGFVDHVHFAGGMLRAQSSAEKQRGLPGAHFLPVSENTFSPEGFAPMIVFERDFRGRVMGNVQQEPDGTITRARRLPER